MSKTNCVNCGHGKDPDAIKCPFCGTTYFDLTGIDLSMRDPVVLMVKDPRTKSTISMKAVPVDFNLNISPGEVMCVLDFNAKPTYIRGEPEASCRIAFRSE